MKNKTVLITGSAVRVGREIALALADDGWDIAIHYYHSKKPAEELATLIKKKKRQAYLVQGDLKKPQDVAKIIPSLAKRGVQLECLINNASTFEKDNIFDLNADSWQLHMDVNLFAPLLLVRDFVHHYKGRNGNIINISDGIRDWSISGTFLSYSLSKIGLENATKLLAKEIAPRIRINALALGPTLEGKQEKEDTFNRLRTFIPLERTSSPREVYEAVRYLLSASSVTGQVISLAGGL